MDAIPNHRGFPAPALAAAAPIRPVVASSPAPNPAAHKGPADYIRALRRRVWMVLALAVPLAVLACILVLRMQPVYTVAAEIEINAPEHDQALKQIVSQDIGQHDSSFQSQYIANRASRLRSVFLQRKAVGAEDISALVSQYDDPATELYRTLGVIPLNHRNSNIFNVTLEGNDPYRTKRLLEVLLREFADEASAESHKKMEDSRFLASNNLNRLQRELEELKEKIKVEIAQSTTLGANGKSLIEEQVVNLGAMLNQKQMRLGELSNQFALMQNFPRTDLDPTAARRQAMIEQLEIERHQIQEMLQSSMRTSRSPNREPAARATAKKLDMILDEIESLKNVRTEVGLTPTEMAMEQYQKEIDADKAEYRRLLKEMRETLPAHQRVLDLIEESKEKTRRIAEMRVRLEDFGIVADSPSITNFIKVPNSIPEPTIPTRPNKPLLIIAALILCLGAGIGLVCVLEYIDHSVKVPEHVSHGLTLPLLGVVPRIRRTALTHRGGHLWTAGSADSLACDAYRNVRASLLGVADRRGPIVTLLVTSAKAGEGKSTTALNLAATCALAGERTLLLDVDLRRPSLADVFIQDEDPRASLGLVDVLKGDLPWQRTLRHTRIQNLDFIPTGDTREAPIEILGTLELRQLLLALSQHYDRVILDGPAVLGLADCRFLGRIVDASLLVVRSGSHHLNTLNRAKAMLEQSHVAIAGVVFNGLTDDIENWSSYHGDYGALPAPGRTSLAGEAMAIA